MFEWFSIVRIADVQSVRWVLAALNGVDRPVSVRRAQSWCARMEAAGLVERAQLGGRGGALVWGTYAGTGVTRPNLHRQTTRHEVAVAAASARYATAGYAWQRDEKPAHVGGHQADGVALGFGWVELVEVELTPKRLPRYAAIFAAYRRRLDLGEADSISYLCNKESERAVRAALGELPAGRSIAPQVGVRSMYDRTGIWVDETLPTWMMTARDRAQRSTRRPRRSSSAALF
ncbi:hypothetical protein [Amnibacterium kyonggiense]|nr:hypothetical protein [Amnibacterium kyonggiense]